MMYTLLRPSHTLITLAILLYSSTFLIWCFLLPFPIWARSLGMLFHSVHGYYIIRRYLLLKRPQSIIALRLISPSDWTIQLKQGDILSAQLTHHSVCLRHFMILNFKPKESRSITVLIGYDSMKIDEFRAWKRQLLLLKRQESV